MTTNRHPVGSCGGTHAHTGCACPVAGGNKPTAESAVDLAFTFTGTQEWHPVDSDDRYPGQFTSHVGERDGFRLRVDPGDNATYDADGFSWSASNGTHTYSGTATTQDEALREAVEAADYVTSGQAELDWLDDE